jgi:hypothetical protein
VDWNVAINSYVELGASGDRASGVFDGSIVVGALPSRIELRTAWLIYGLADVPSYFPVARMRLVHYEPGAETFDSAEPEIYHALLDRLDGSSVLFLAYTIGFKSTGAHRVGFPQAEVPELTVMIQTASR